MRTRNRCLLAIGCLFFTLLRAVGADLDVAGDWALRLDSEDKGVEDRAWDQPFPDQIRLPGTTALAGKGTPLEIDIKLEGPAMQHLHQRFRHVGPAWYQRRVQIPETWAGQDVILELERVIWESRAWVDGVEAARPERSLTTPHRHDLTALIKPGTDQVLTLRIDNREKVPLGTSGHSYTDETQSIWNGVVGKIRLSALPRLRIEHLRLRPDYPRGGINTVVEIVNHTGQEQNTNLVITPSQGRPVKVAALAIPEGISQHAYFVELPTEIAQWSEFSPTLHSVEAVLGQGETASRQTGRFGFREFRASGRSFMVNGHRTFLRGTVNCAEFPATGHPEMTGQQWEKIFRTAGSYGLNHLRFHSWCPPEIAFETADRLGFYLQVELPNWTFKMGQHTEVDAFLREEARRLLREYGNHPSFVMLSLGNELGGDWTRVDAFVRDLRQLEPGLMFTSTSFSFSPRGKKPGPADDFFISQETACGWVRGQGFLNNTRPNTAADYAAGLACIPVPLVTHEVGQYVAYPNLAELPKYETGPLRATAWEAIRADLQAKGRLDEAARYVRDSGRLAALLYKEDLERALRTKDLAGIQLLQLQDFPGQSTATVGLLDAFWDSKGLIQPEEFRQFCGPTVPLARMAKLVLENTESLAADLELAHFGPEPIDNGALTWALRDGDRVVGEGQFKLARLMPANGHKVGRVTQKLDSVKTAARLELTVQVAGTQIRNQWSVWVYPATADPAGKEVVVFEAPDHEFYQALEQGRRVLLNPRRASVKDPIDGRFIPVFWSPLHFPNQPGTLGATIDAQHPVWNQFPTGTHTDWQWWELLSQSYAINFDGLPQLAMPFRFIDKYNRNALPAGVFEAQVGSGRLLVCTLDITSDLNTRITARQLRRSLLAYAASDDFKPAGELTTEQVQGLFSEAP